MGLARPSCRTAIAAGLLAALAATASTAGPGVGVQERRGVALRVRPLTAPAVAPPPGGNFEMDLDAGRSASLAFAVRWPDEDSTTSVAILAITRPPQGAANAVRLEATVALPGGERHTASRDLVFDESATVLFEVARSDERSLTLAIEAEEVRETVFSARPTAGDPVVLNVEVAWQENGQSTSLETNRLSTFVGEEVSYAFRLGETGSAEALEVRLKPLGVFGDVLQLRAEISGSIPRNGKLEVLSRSEQWMVSRGESSALDVTTGDPPVGFRFVVTPRF